MLLSSCTREAVTNPTFKLLEAALTEVVVDAADILLLPDLFLPQRSPCWAATDPRCFGEPNFAGHIFHIMIAFLNS